MASYFTALNAVLAHRFSHPAPDVAPADQVDWFFEHADLWSEVARTADDWLVAERAYDMADQARTEGQQVAVPASPWAA